MTNISEYMNKLIQRAEIPFVMQVDKTKPFSFYLKAAEDIINSVGWISEYFDLINNRPTRLKTKTRSRKPLFCTVDLPSRFHHNHL